MALQDFFACAPKAEEAFPPDCLVSQRGSEDGLDGVHAVLRLVEDDGARALKDLVRHLQRLKMELLADLAADAGVEVVERRQAVHDRAFSPAASMSF